MFDLSNSISLHLFLILLKIIVHEKEFQKPNSPPAWVFFLIKLTLFFQRGLNILVKQIDKIIEFYEYKLLLKLFPRKKFLLIKI